MSPRLLVSLRNDSAQDKSAVEMERNGHTEDLF